MQQNETESNQNSPKGATRKGKQNLEWIGVACNQDRNMQLLMHKFGVYGLGFYIELRRRIGANREGGYWLAFTHDDFEMFCAEARIDEKTAEEMLDYCFSKGLFDKNLHEQHNILTGVDSAVNWCESAKERQSFSQGIVMEYLCIDIKPYLEYNAKKFTAKEEPKNNQNENVIALPGKEVVQKGVLIADTREGLKDTREGFTDIGEALNDTDEALAFKRSKEKYNEVKKEEKPSEAKKSETKQNISTPTEFKTEVFMNLDSSNVLEQNISQGSFSTQNTDIQGEIAQIEDAKVVNLHKNENENSVFVQEKEKSSAKKEKAKIPPHGARLGIIQMFENQTGVPFMPGKESNTQLAHICRTLDAYLLKANGYEPTPEMVLQLYHDLWAMKAKLKPFYQESLYSISGTAKFLPEMLPYLNGKMVIENVEANKKPTKIMKMSNLANEFMNMKTSQVV